MYVELIGDKQCVRCKQVKPLTDFRLDRSKRDGRQASCGKCRAERQHVPKDKRCPGCEQVKPPTDFARSAARADGLGGYCRECVSVNGSLALRHRTDRLLRAHPVPAFNHGWIGWRVAA